MYHGDPGRDRPWACRGGRIPLSATQRRWWRQHQLDHTGVGARVAGAVRIRGPLELAALRRAFDDCLVRHVALRTSVRVERGRPYQRVESRVALALPVHDLVEHEFPEGAATLAAAPFDLAAAPLLRGHVFRFGAEHHVVMLVAHRVVADDAALNVLFADLAEGYSAALAGHSAAPARPRGTAVCLAPDPASTSYWVERLRDLPPLDLPLDRPRIDPAGRAAYVRFRLARERAAGVARLARVENLPVETVLQAAFAAFLARLSGQREVAFAVPVSGRVRPGDRTTVGCLDNEVVLRIATDPPQRPDALVHQVREVALAAHAHADLPWNEVLAALRPGRLEGRNPLYDAVLAVRPGRTYPPHFAGARAEWLLLDAGRTTVDLAVELRPEAQTIVGQWEYRSDLFDEQTVVAWTQIFTELLAPARPGRAPRGVLPRRRGARLAAGRVTEFLGAAPVGTEDDVSDFGGPAEPAAELVARIEQASGVALRPGEVVALRTPAVLGARVDRPDAAPVTRAATTGVRRYPMSSAQRRIWSLERARPGCSSHPVAVAAFLVGPLSIPLLRTACAQLLIRHETLRTVFGQEAGAEPEAVLLAPSDVLTVVEGSADGPAPDAEAQALRLLRRSAGMPFDLATGPLLRVVLVRLGGDRFGLSLATDRIACDGESLRLLVADLGAAYENPSGLARRDSPARRYADFARGEPAQATAGLVTADPVPVNPASAEVVTGALDARLADAVGALAEEHGASLSVVLRCALHVVLDRWTGDREVVVWSPVTTRPRPDFDGVIGPFTELRARAGTARRNPTARRPGGRATFDVLFDHQVGERPELWLAGLHATPVELPEPDAGLPLELHARSHADGIELRALCRGRELSASLVRALLKQLVAVLDHAAYGRSSPLEAPGRSR